MKNAIVLTVIADDKPGIVRRVSGVLKEHGGNWTHSSMARLAGHFAGILMANVPAANEQACLAALRDLEQEGITIIARTGADDEAGEPARDCYLEVVGNDRPGIVADITALLHRHGVSVHGLKTSVEGASMAGGELFRAQATLRVPEHVSCDALAAELEDMANDLMVDIHLEK